MAEHDWEELFVVRDCPRGSGRPEPVYAGLDRCRNCKTLRSTVNKPFWYMQPNWIRQTPSLWEPVCKEYKGFRLPPGKVLGIRDLEAEGLNQEEIKRLNRIKEIMRMAHKLKWVYPPNETSYPLMQLSEVEKCMLAVYNDFDLNRMRKWVEETQSSEQDKEAEG